MSCPRNALARPEFAASYGVAAREALGNCGIASWIQMAILLPLFAGAYAALALGLTSFIIEFDADVWAVRHLKNPTTLLDAMARLAEDEPRLAKASWLHPSMKSRERMMQWAIAHPRKARRAQSVIAWLAAIVMTSMVAWFITQSIVH